MESSDKKCVICCLVLQEAIQTTCGHFLCRDCSIMRENGASRCPVDDLPLSQSEHGDGDQARVPSYNASPAEPLAEQDNSQQDQQALGYQANNEQGGAPSPPDNETDQTISPRMIREVRQASNQQGDARQVNGGGCHTLELEQIADQTVSAYEGRTGHQEVNGRSGGVSTYSMTNGGGTSEASFPIQETELVSDQSVNGLQQQIPHQQEGGALVNGLSYRNQEIHLDALQRPDRPVYQPPYQEVGSDQVCEYNIPVQETGQVAGQLLYEHEDLPPCFQELNVADMNGVSSTGQAEQAIEHSCSRQEVLLWKQTLARSPPQKATRKKMNRNETFHIFEITEVQQLSQVTNGLATPFFSSAIYTDGFEYKLGIRMYLNGVGTGNGRFVAVFIHMMMGKYDNLDVNWPFNQRITLSILDQSGAKSHISQTMQARPNMSAFQKPTEAISPTGCGFVKFASVEEVFSLPYVKDDKLFLKIEFFS